MMSAWKRTILSVYYGATLPARRRAASKRAARETEPVQILFYHRIADEYPNGWTMSTRTFSAQITWLSARFDVVCLSEAQARIASGRNDRPTVCITFDDGYADNMRSAVRLLLERRLPFTYFVSTNHILRGEPFPHDVQAGRPLLPNTPDDVRQLAEAGVEIGAHTRNHADLGGSLPRAKLVDEMAGSKSDLENLIGREVKYFAFPYGQLRNMPAEAYRVGHSAGFLGVCSAYGGYNLPGDNPFHLRRIHADPEMIRFKNWLTIDPRKIRTQSDFGARIEREISRKDAKA